MKPDGFRQAHYDAMRQPVHEETPQESIQRGDRVYYRGEVWTVWKTRYDSYTHQYLHLQRQGSEIRWDRDVVDSRYVQRVEAIQ